MARQITQKKLSICALFAVVFIGIFFLVPITSAQEAQGLVAVCEGRECSACDLADLANNVIKWLIGIMFLLFAVLTVVAGFGLVTSNGNTGALQDAKKKLTNGIIGIVIVLAAWLLVDTMMRALIGNNGEIRGYGPWSEIACGEQVITEINTDLYPEVYYPGDPADPAVSGSGGGPSGPMPTGCTGGSCSKLSVPCKAGCSVSPDLVNKINKFHADAGVSGARVTEAMPPTRRHKSACHSNGTCIDYSKSGGMTAAEVLRVINAAKNNGLRPVYEVKTQAEKDRLVSGGVPAANIKVLGSWISAPHFSIYGY